MSFTTNPKSVLFQLRQLMPNRSLTQSEARHIAELQANKLLIASGVSEPGTPAEIITTFSNLRVSRRADLPASGYVNWFKPHWMIYLNAHEPAVRQRFSLFHELKHVLDHPFIDKCYPSTTAVAAEKRAEQIADYFAACMLMPKLHVRSAYFQGQHDVDELAGMFGVSSTAMRFRLQDLGLLERTSRVLPSTLRTTWRPRRSGGGRPFFRTPSPAPPPSPLALKETA